MVHELVREGCPVVTLDLGGSRHRLEYLLEPEELDRVPLVQLDVTDTEGLVRTLDEHGITNVVHLAALQVPFCKADPLRGAIVNVAGTVSVFEAVKRSGARERPIVYASSVAVYSPTDGAGGLAPDEPGGLPATHYGVYKRANEGSAHVYWADDGVASVGLRPYVIYGVGRDQGLTSSPTQAMLAAALGRTFHIPYGGVTDMQYAQDVARSFVAASRSDYRGAGVFNVGGSVVHMREVVAAIERAAPQAAGRITFDDAPLAFPPGADSDSLPAAIRASEPTPLDAGVAATMERFRSLHERGRLAA